MSEKKQINAVGSSMEDASGLQPLSVIQPVIESVIENKGDWREIDSGGTTGEATPTLRGTGQANTAVAIIVNGRFVSGVRVDNSGSWEFTPTLVEGRNEIRVSSPDTGAGEAYVIDFMPVPVPVVKPEIISAWDNVNQVGKIPNGSSTDDQTPTLSGKGEPNSLLTVHINGEPVSKISVGQNGEWSFTPTLAEGRSEIVVTYLGSPGAPGFMSGTYVIEYVPTPQVNPVIVSGWADEGQVGEVVNGGTTDDRTIRLSGTGVPNVLLSVHLNGKAVNVVTVDEHGQWDFVANLQDGRNEIFVTTPGVPGSADPISDMFVIDYVPAPAAKPEIVSGWADQGQVGDISNGGVTDDITPRIQGRGEPNTYLNILVNGQIIDVVSVNQFGEWQMNVALSEGRNEISLSTPSGITSEIFVIEFVPAPVPKPTFVSVWDDYGEMGYINDGGVTDDSRPFIRGTGEPNTILTMTINGRFLSDIRVDHHGNWSYTPQLAEGRNEIVVASSSQQGDAEATFVIEYVPSVWPLEIVSAWDDHGQTGEIGSGGITDDRTPSLRGTADPSSLMSLTINGQFVTTILVDKTGSWSFSPKLNVGYNEIILHSYNAPGLVSEPFVIEYAPPPAIKPHIVSAWDDFGSSTGLISNGSTIDDSTPFLQGIGEPNTYIQLSNNGRFISSIRVDDSGNWNYTPNLSVGLNELVLTTQDGVASQAFVIELGITQPVATVPEITFVWEDKGQVGKIPSGGITDDRMPSLYGTGEPRQVLELTLNGRVEMITVVDRHGKWNFDLRLDDGQNVLTVKVNGHVSEPFYIDYVSSTSMNMTNVVDLHVESGNEDSIAVLSLTDLLSDGPADLFSSHSGNSVEAEPAVWAFDPADMALYTTIEGGFIYATAAASNSTDMLKDETQQAVFY